MKHNRLTIWLPIVMASVLAIGVWMGYTVSSARPKQKKAGWAKAKPKPNARKKKR